MITYLNNKTFFMDKKCTAWQTVKRFSIYVLDLKTTLGLGVLAMLGYGIVDATLLNILQPLVDDGFNTERGLNTDRKLLKNNQVHVGPPEDDEEENL